jgi:RimJ/RimL family protein N-acetyltransferase
MGTRSANVVESEWRRQLPTLVGREVVLREPDNADLPALAALLSLADSSRFGVREPVTADEVRRLFERCIAERAAGVSFTYLVTVGTTRAIVGLAQVRRLDPLFEAGEWEITLLPSARGTGVFLEAAQLIASFAFGAVGAFRLELRALLQNGRANGALRKLGAVQEGILRHSIRRNGRYLDQSLWSLLREDWSERAKVAGSASGAKS